MPRLILTDQSYVYLDDMTIPHQETDRHALLADLVYAAFRALPPADTPPLESLNDETP